MSEQFMQSHPKRITLAFRNGSELREFLGGLSDGFGENFVDLHWFDGDLGAAEIIAVDVPDDVDARQLCLHENLAKALGDAERERHRAAMAQTDATLTKIDMRMKLTEAAERLRVAESERDRLVLRVAELESSTAKATT